jgi:hypothetical protein
VIDDVLKFLRIAANVDESDDAWCRNPAHSTRWVIILQARIAEVQHKDHAADGAERLLHDLIFGSSHELSLDLRHLTDSQLHLLGFDD